MFLLSAPIFDKSKPQLSDSTSTSTSTPTPTVTGIVHNLEGATAELAGNHLLESGDASQSKSYNPFDLDKETIRNGEVKTPHYPAESAENTGSSLNPFEVENGGNDGEKAVVCNISEKRTDSVQECVGMKAVNGDSKVAASPSDPNLEEKNNLKNTSLASKSSSSVSPKKSKAWAGFSSTTLAGFKGPISDKDAVSSGIPSIGEPQATSTPQRDNAEKNKYNRCVILVSSDFRFGHLRA